MDSPLVTILLPIYNDEKWLEFCLNGILAQTFSNFICLVGFNGTTDESPSIFERVCGEDKRFVSYHLGDQKGKSKTLNFLLDKVNSKFICLIDGDDMWHEEKLAIQVSECEEGISVLGTQTFYIDEKNEIVNRIWVPTENFEIRKELRQGSNPIINSSCLLNSLDVKEVGGWHEETEGIEDLDLWLRLYLANKNFKNLPDYLVFHRIHQTSNFNSKKLNISNEDLLRKNMIIGH